MTEPGWYPDTEVEGGQRYFDGDEWTDDRTPPSQPGPSGPWQSFRSWPLWAQVLSWVGVGFVVVIVIGLIGQAVAPPKPAEEAVVIFEEEPDTTAPQTTAAPTTATPTTTTVTTTQPVDTEPSAQGGGVPGYVTAAEFGEEWPLTVDSAVVACPDDFPIAAIDGTTYGLTGYAQTTGGYEVWEASNPLWADDAFTGAKKNIKAFRDAAMDLCENDPRHRPDS